MPTVDERLERNKRTVMVFYDLMFKRLRKVEAVERYVGATYSQHNPMVADGKGGIHRWTSTGWPGSTPASGWNSSG